MGCLNSLAAAYGRAAGCPGGYTPPYAAPSDLWAYLLAFSPLLFSVLEIVFYNPFAHAPGDVIPAVGFWIGLLLAWADARNLNRSRRNPRLRTMVPFVLLTPIGFFGGAGPSP